MKKTKKKRNGPGQTSLYVWGIPKDVKAKFKARCAANGTSMTQELIKFMLATKSFTCGCPSGLCQGHPGCPLKG